MNMPELGKEGKTHQRSFLDIQKEIDKRLGEPINVGALRELTLKRNEIVANGIKDEGLTEIRKFFNGFIFNPQNINFPDIREQLENPKIQEAVERRFASYYNKGENKGVALWIIQKGIDSLEEKMKAGNSQDVAKNEVFPSGNERGWLNKLMNREANVVEKLAVEVRKKQQEPPKSTEPLVEAHPTQQTPPQVEVPTEEVGQKPFTSNELIDRLLTGNDVLIVEPFKVYAGKLRYTKNIARLDILEEEILSISINEQEIAQLDRLMNAVAVKREELERTQKPSNQNTPQPENRPQTPPQEPPKPPENPPAPPEKKDDISRLTGAEVVTNCKALEGKKRNVSLSATEEETLKKLQEEWQKRMEEVGSYGMGTAIQEVFSATLSKNITDDKKRDDDFQRELDRRINTIKQRPDWKKFEGIVSVIIGAKKTELSLQVQGKDASKEIPPITDVEGQRKYIREALDSFEKLSMNIARYDRFIENDRAKIKISELLLLEKNGRFSPEISRELRARISLQETVQVVGRDVVVANVAKATGELQSKEEGKQGNEMALNHLITLLVDGLPGLKISEAWDWIQKANGQYESVVGMVNREQFDRLANDKGVTSSEREEAWKFFEEIYFDESLFRKLQQQDLIKYNALIKVIDPGDPINIEQNPGEIRKFYSTYDLLPRKEGEISAFDKRRRGKPIKTFTIDSDIRRKEAVVDYIKRQLGESGQITKEGDTSLEIARKLIVATFENSVYNVDSLINNDDLARMTWFRYFRARKYYNDKRQVFGSPRTIEFFDGFGNSWIRRVYEEELKPQLTKLKELKKEQERKNKTLTQKEEDEMKDLSKKLKLLEKDEKTMCFKPFLINNPEIPDMKEVLREISTDATKDWVPFCTSTLGNFSAVYEILTSTIEKTDFSTFVSDKNQSTGIAFLKKNAGMLDTYAKENFIKNGHLIRKHRIGFIVGLLNQGVMEFNKTDMTLIDKFKRIVTQEDISVKSESGKDTFLTETEWEIAFSEAKIGERLRYVKTEATIDETSKGAAVFAKGVLGEIFKAAKK